MSTTERAYERLVAANPMPDPERYMATVLDIDTAPDDLKEVMMSTKTDDRRSMEVIDRGPLGGRWRIALATFVAVLAVAGGILVATLVGEGRDSAGDTPIGVVEAFFERWNDGDVDGAMALVSPEVTAFGIPGAANLKGLIEYTSQFDGRMEVDCQSAAIAGRVTCDWAFASPGVEALGLPVNENRLFTVVDGLITTLVPAQYPDFETQLAAFAESEDPVGYAEECSPDGISPLGLAGHPFNVRCGAFLAGLEGAFVASLGG